MRPICQYWHPHAAIQFAIPDASHVCSAKLFDDPRWRVSVFMGGVLTLHAGHVVDDFGTLVQVTPWR